MALFKTVASLPFPRLCLGANSFAVSSIRICQVAHDGKVAVGFSRSTCAKATYAVPKHFNELPRTPIMQEIAWTLLGTGGTNRRGCRFCLGIGPCWRSMSSREVENGPRHHMEKDRQPVRRMREWQTPFGPLSGVKWVSIWWHPGEWLLLMSTGDDQS